MLRSSVTIVGHLFQEDYRQVSHIFKQMSLKLNWRSLRRIIFAEYAETKKELKNR